MKYIILLLTLSSTAHGTTDFCNVIQDAKIVKTLPVPENVNYFIRGAPDTAEIGFATSNGNILLDSKTGKKTEVPGTIDPILTPDGKILSVPQSLLYDPKTKKYSPKPKDYEGLEIYQGRVSGCEGACSLKEIEASGKPYVIQVMTFYSRDSLDKPLFIDKNASFSYQSFGKLRKNGSVTSYRMLFETQEGIRARDYEYNEASKKLSPAGPIKALCKSLRGYLPAQSKSGDEYSAYDAEKGVTHVFSIGKSGNECKITETLPGMVGKIDFSPDGKRLAYHVDKTMDNNFNKNIIKSAGAISNIESVVFDREKKIPAIIAKSTETNSYYPIFLDNNTLAYIDSTKVETWKQTPRFSIKLAELQELTTPKCPRCFESGTSEEQMAAFIGVIRDKTCESNPKFYFKNGTPSFSNLRVSQCQSVVDSCDSKCLSEIKAKIENVSAGGGILDAKGTPLRTIQKWDVETVLKFEKEDLSAFCRKLKVANTITPGETGQQKGAQ